MSHEQRNLQSMVSQKSQTWLSDYKSIRFSSVQSLSRVWLFATPWIAARQASLSNTISWSSLKFTSIESVIPSSHLILCHPLLLLPPIPPSIRVFSNGSTLHMRWLKYWSFSFSIIPSKEIPGLLEGTIARVHTGPWILPTLISKTVTQACFVVFTDFCSVNTLTIVISSYQCPWRRRWGRGTPAHCYVVFGPCRCSRSK